MLVNKHNLQIADLCDKRESRYTVDAIHVTDQYSEVTNGHYLVRVSTSKLCTDADFPAVNGFVPANGEATDTLLSREVAQEVCKAIPSKSTIAVLKHAAIATHEKQVSIAVTDLETPKVFHLEALDGHYPNIDSVIPKEGFAKLTFGVDARYLMMLAKSAIAHAGHGKVKTAVIKIEVKAANSALKLSCANSEGQTWVAVLMPVRL